MTITTARTRELREAIKNADLARFHANEEIDHLLKEVDRLTVKASAAAVMAQQYRTELAQIEGDRT